MTFNVEHNAFSDDAYFSKKIEGYGQEGISDLFNLFFKKRPFYLNVETDVGEYDIDEWFKIYRITIVEWLKKKV